jgi:hypothetical protein
LKKHGFALLFHMLCYYKHARLQDASPNQGGENPATMSMYETPTMRTGVSSEPSTPSGPPVRLLRSTLWGLNYGWPPALCCCSCNIQENIYREVAEYCMQCITLKPPAMYTLAASRCHHTDELVGSLICRCRPTERQKGTLK